MIYQYDWKRNQITVPSSAHSLVDDESAIIEDQFPFLARSGFTVSTTADSREVVEGILINAPI